MNSNTTNNIAILDIDGTLVKGQSQQLFMAYSKKRGYISLLSYVRVMIWFFLYKLNILKNPKKILAYSLEGFENKDMNEIHSLMKDFVEEVIQTRYYKHTRDLIELFTSNNYRVVLLSSAVEPVVQAIAKNLHIEEYLCTKIKIVENRIQGSVDGEQVYEEEKLNKINRYLANANIQYKNLVVVADHYSDISLLLKGTKSFVANPNRIMEKWASQNNIPVIYLDNNESIQYIESYIVSQ